MEKKENPFMPPASMFAGVRACLLATLVLALGACDGADRFTQPSDDPVDVAAATPVAFDGGSLASSYRGGIPFGNFAQPSSAFGAQFNGGLKIISPSSLLAELATIKARGGRVVLNIAGGQSRYTDGKGHFSLNLWKASVDRYKGVNFSSYINDGTVISNYLIDEPHDEANWNGMKVSPATLDEMARYSKELWPNMPTVVRAYPDYLAGLNGKYEYLDAAWVQYVHRFGDIDDFTRKHASLAQQKGLSLIGGLNTLAGGPDKRQLTADQLESWGSALLSSGQICAFISWEFDAKYLERAEIKRAMAVLAGKAESRASKSCRGTNGQTTGAAPEPSEPREPPVPTEPPAPPAPPVTPNPSEGPVTAIQLRAAETTQKGGKQYVLLTWSGAAGSRLDLYRNGDFRRQANNTGRTSIRVNKSRTAQTVKVCESGSARCSNTVTVQAK
jgi:hypothetical protein